MSVLEIIQLFHCIAHILYRNTHTNILNVKNQFIRFLNNYKITYSFSYFVKKFSGLKVVQKQKEEVEQEKIK